MGEAPRIWSPCRSFGSSKTQRLQEAAGFGQRGSAQGWSWGSPLALAEFLKEMGKSIPVSLLERNRCPGPRVPERTKNHCNTSQKPWEKSITTSICHAKLPDPRHVMGVWLRHPLEGAPGFHPTRSCWTTATVGEEFLSIILPPLRPKAIAAFPSPLLQNPCRGCHVT